MGFPVLESDAEEAQQQGSELRNPDWYVLYCQAISAGIDPREFGDYTYSQIIAAIDGHKLSRYNDMYFNVSNTVSQMSDDNVREAMSGTASGNPLRAKLVQRMMKPYSPSFLISEIAQARSAQPIPGLSPKTAEGIMQAIEARLVSHTHWLSIHPIWQRVLATARQYGQ